MDAAGAKALRARLEAAGPVPLRARIAVAEAGRRRRAGGAPAADAMPLYRWLGVAPPPAPSERAAEEGAARKRPLWWTTRESEA